MNRVYAHTCNCIRMDLDNHAIHTRHTIVLGYSKGFVSKKYDTGR